MSVNAEKRDDSPSGYQDQVRNAATSIFTADPASFFIVVNIISQVRSSVTEFRTFLAERPELKVIFEKTLLLMRQAGFIDLNGDEIVVLRSTPFVDLRTADFNLFPKLLGTVARRIRDNYLKDPKAAFKSSDEFFWRTLPDHPKVRQRLFQITSKFTAELDALSEEIKNDPKIVGERVRLFSFLCGNLEPEDF